MYPCEPVKMQLNSKQREVLFINQTFGNILHHLMTVVKIVTAFDLNRVKTTLYTKKYFPEREKRKCFEYLIFFSHVILFLEFQQQWKFLKRFMRTISKEM